MLKLGFIGAGTVGTALATLLDSHGYRVAAVSSRSRTSAENLAGAMDTMYEWLYDGAPLTITCKQEFQELLRKLAPGFHTLPDGARVNLRELLLLLVQTDVPERVAVDHLITRLWTIFDNYSHKWGP